MGENTSLFSRIVTWTILGVLALLALKLAFGLLGIVLGFAGFLLFTVGPILLVGWLALKAWNAFSKEPAA